jgi:3-methyladenine DNA glycosylase AlkC
MNHMEQIALDMDALMRFAFPRLAADAPRLATGGLVTRMRTGGRILHERLGDDAWRSAVGSSSDTVRGWGAMAIGAAPNIALANRLALVRPFADDEHFAVREWAWLALRPHVTADPLGAIAALSSWAYDPAPNVRRFASEGTRPRGVWSTHIPLLKHEPHWGLPVIEPLFADPARYVQTSVSNWLNDASRTSPEWVRETCARIGYLGSPHGARICARALRTIGPA